VISSQITSSSPGAHGDCMTAIAPSLMARRFDSAVFTRAATRLWLWHRSCRQKEIGLRNAGLLVHPGDHLPARQTLTLPEQMRVLPGNPEPMRQLARAGNAVLSEQFTQCHTPSLH
jgi:hypothetical protein